MQTVMVKRILITAMIAVLTAGHSYSANHLDVGNPGRADVVIEREGYALGYSKKHHQAKWVQYRLTGKQVLSAEKVARTNDFRPDPQLPATISDMRDYSKSGYDKGHLAPAEDMRYSAKTESESFYMSNMSPQSQSFNRGIWKRLERQVRRFAYEEGSVVVVTGPIFPASGGRKLGEMSVASKFYKVVYSEGTRPKMIGFIVPHDAMGDDIKRFVCTVGKVEEETGLKFFTKLPRDVQRDLKTRSSPSEWGLR